MKMKGIVFCIGILFSGVAAPILAPSIQQTGPSSDSRLTVVNFWRLSDCTNTPSEELSALVDANDDFHYRSLYSDLVDPNGQSPVRSAEIEYTSGGNNDLNNLTTPEQKLLLTYFECIAGVPAMSLDRSISEAKPNCGWRDIHLMKPVEGGLSYIDNTLFPGGKFNSSYVFDNLLSTAAQKLLSESAGDNAVLDGQTALEAQKAEGAFASLLTHVLLSAHRPYSMLFPLMLDKYNKSKDTGKDSISMITKDEVRDAVNKLYAPMTRENAERCSSNAMGNALVYEVLVNQERMDAELGDVEARAWITNKTLIRLHDLRDQIGAERTAEIVKVGKRFLESIYSGLVDVCKNSDGEVLFAEPDFSEKLIKSLDKHWAFSIDAVRLYWEKFLDVIIREFRSVRDGIVNGWRKVSDAVSSVVQSVKAKFTILDADAKKQS